MSTDRRVRYTKMVLKESLIKLLFQKPISRITVTELCKKADINRATFYSHYTDQFDLLKQIENDFIADINSYLSGFTLEQGEAGLIHLISKIFEYIAENQKLCRVLLGGNGNLEFQTKIKEVVGERVFFEWGKETKIDGVTAKHIYTYIATGSIGVIRNWLTEEKPEPPRKMAALVAKLANRGMEAFIA